MTVNIALRRQLYQLSYFTEGNVPEALIGTPEAWSPAQIKEFQQYWDALLEGNLGQRRHAKFVPGGVAKTFIPTKEVELKSAYDEWLARVICFAFSISPQAFTDHMNRATAETAHDTALAEGLAPLQNWIKQLVDYVIITEFAAPDLEFQWRDDRETDPQQAAGIAQIYVTNGIKTINEIRSDIGLDPVPGGDTPMVFTGTGPVPLTQIGAGGLGKAYNPNQPRNPAGEGRVSGRFASENGGSGDSTDNTDAGPKDDGTGDTTGSRDRSRGTQVASIDDGTRSDAGSLPAPSSGSDVSTPLANDKPVEAKPSGIFDTLRYLLQHSADAEAADAEMIANAERENPRLAVISGILGLASLLLPLLPEIAAGEAAGTLGVGGEAAADAGVGAEAAGAGAEGATAEGAAAATYEGFSAAESQVINEAKAILSSPELNTLRAAYEAGEQASVRIGGRLITYEPDLPAYGFSNFPDNGFHLGRLAFSQPGELGKTILHELYRLAFSESTGSGVFGELASGETFDADAFANQAARFLQ